MPFKRNVLCRYAKETGDDAGYGAGGGEGAAVHSHTDTRVCVYYRLRRLKNPERGLTRDLDERRLVSKS